MAAKVVCISRATHTGAEEIAAQVASELGFRYVDEEIVARAAQRRNLAPAEVATAERRKSYLRTLMSDLGEGGADVINYIQNSKTGTPGDVRDLIRQAITETADEGNVVIVAHAASFALARRKQVLRVLITGSEFGRVTRWSLTSGGKSPRQAQEVIRESDSARADYLKRFYDVKHESPEHYDITLSTDALQPPAIKELILAAARLID
jgi:cytidylate kinase